MVLNGGREVGLQLSEADTVLGAARASAHEDADGFNRIWSVASYAICADPVAGLAPQSRGKQRHHLVRPMSARHIGTFGRRRSDDRLGSDLPQGAGSAHRGE